jgi:hypothetical protein
MKQAIIKGLGIIGAFASLASGCFWFLSAQIQLATGPQAALVKKPLETLTFLANQQNFWAAACAMIAGIAIGLAIAFDD